VRGSSPSLVRERPAGRDAKPARGVHLRLAVPISEIRLPATVQSVVAARIDSLPEPAKLVLQTAAVIGKRFSEPVLRHALVAGEALAEHSPAAAADRDAILAKALRTLKAADLIHAEPPDNRAEYAFKHPLTQEVAYASQLQETRARKHEAVARALETVHADRLGEYATLLAHHWEAADKRYETQLWRRRAMLRVTNIQTRRERGRRQ